MSEIKYHVSRSGVLSQCGATKRACPLKGEHYSQDMYDKLVLDGDPRIRKTTKKSDLNVTQNKAKSSAIAFTPSPDSVKKKSQPKEPVVPLGEVIYRKRKDLNFNESSPATIIHKEPVECFENMGNVECVCGKVRYEQRDACQCKKKEIAGFRIRKSEEKLLQSKVAVKTRFWYHSTSVPNWDETIKTAGVPVHLGNETTAHEVSANHHYDGGPKEYFIYKVMLNPFASISDVVCQDLSNDWSETMDQFNSRADGDLVRYVNTYENAGTVSLIGNPKKFIIIGKTSHSV